MKPHANGHQHHSANAAEESAIAGHEARIQNVVRRARDREGWVAATERTPLEVLLSEEPECDLDGEPAAAPYAWPSAEQGDVQITALKREEAAEIAAWVRLRLMQWIFGDGVHPFRICQRVFALALFRYPDLIGPLNGHWLAEMLGQGRAAFSALMKRLFNVELEARSGRPVSLGNQKNAASREKYAANAREHLPRRRLRSEHEEEDAEREDDGLRERKKTLAAQQAAHGKKVRAETEAFFEGLKAKARSANIEQ